MNSLYFGLSRNMVFLSCLYGSELFGGGSVCVGYFLSCLYGSER